MEGVRSSYLFQILKIPAIGIHKKYKFGVDFFKIAILI
jgi:hypothetical protein